MRYLYALVALFGFLPAQQPAPEPATLVLRNGKVVTVDAALPEAQAIAVRGDKILAVGSNADIAKLAGPNTRVVDAKGKLVIPGMIDTHAHVDTRPFEDFELMAVAGVTDVLTLAHDGHRDAVFSVPEDLGPALRPLVGTEPAAIVSVRVRAVRRNKPFAADFNVSVKP